MNGTAVMRKQDWMTVLALMAITLILFLRFFNLSAYPAEDAAMLMRYAKHFGEGHGFVWNVGEKPLDGASDFLSVLLIGAGVKLGLNLEIATRALGMAAHLATIFVIYTALRTFQRAKWIAAVLTASYFAFGPGLAYIQAYFGTPLFALGVAVSWFFALKIMDHPSKKDAAIFALTCLLTSMVRSEGVFLAGLMLLAVMVKIGLKKSIPAIGIFVGVFAVLGGAYFFGRLHYFGDAFPNPFYVKRSLGLSVLGLKLATKNFVLLAAPFLLPYALALTADRDRNRVVFIPILGFIAIWMLLSDSMNFMMRYQYPILPVVLMSWPALVPGFAVEGEGAPSFPGLKKVLLSVPAILIIGGICFWQVSQYRRIAFRDGRYDVAQILHKYSDKSYTLAVSEAGLLPLYSEWRAIDTWGLNDRWIAHRGRITEDYLDQTKPEVILFHAFFSPLSEENPADLRWNEMVKVLKQYAEKRSYRLAAVYGPSPYESHYYYVRADFPESDEIVHQIQTMDYYWSEGQKAFNLTAKGIGA